MVEVVERARRYIARCPVAISGQGGHDATFHVAAVLVWGFALGEAEALMLLQEWNRNCVPPWSDAELIHKVKSAAGAQHRDARGHLVGDGFKPGASQSGPAVTVVRPAKPEFRPMVLKRIAAKAAVGDVVAFIGQRSPVRVDTQDSASVLRRLYPCGSGEKILIFSDMRSQGQMLWEANKSDFVQNQHLPAGGDGVWFLPQPVDGLFHPNPRGERRTPSRRSEESVRAWRYGVLESDEADPEDWLRCLIQMPLRIASVCESGKRSIHALVRLDAESKADWDSKVKVMKPVLVTLGADAGALSAVRLTRLPQAKRGERLQRLLYLNPSPYGSPIVSGMEGGE
jgi:hypothetical protein